VSARRVFVTGASGCVGHYVVETLVRESRHELFLLVRDPARLRIDWRARPGVTLVVGDMAEIARHADLLRTMDAAVLTAAAWGGAQQVRDVNVDGTLTLLRLLDPARCEPVLYFSTASILDGDHGPLPEAWTEGTEYIRSKAECRRALAALPIASRVVTLFPTLVLGGDARHPYSHPATLLRAAFRWLGLIRLFTAPERFHFIHAADVARIVHHLLDHPESAPPARDLVLGNPALSLGDAIDAACALTRRRRPVRIPLTSARAQALLALFRVKLTPWDRFCMKRGDQIFRDPIAPAHFGLPTAYPTIESALRTLLPPS
jgi:nucleoside-diphosphate-sugar epimerase